MRECTNKVGIIVTPSELKDDTVVHISEGTREEGTIDAD